MWMRRSITSSEPRPGARFVLRAVEASFLALGLGCAAFNPRDPIAPGQSNDPCAQSFVEAQTAEALAANIKRGLECQRVDTIYQPSLDPLFTYVPDPNLDPSFFVGWNLTREIQTMQHALLDGPNAPDSLRMTYRTFQRSADQPVPDAVRYDVEYLVQMWKGATLRRYGACAKWDLAGISLQRVTLRRWDDVAQFGAPGSCAPDPGGNVRGSLGQLRLEEAP
jgi:hypothetical protein